MRYSPPTQINQDELTASRAASHFERQSGRAASAEMSCPDGPGHDVAFVPCDVHVVAAVVLESHPYDVHTWAKRDSSEIPSFSVAAAKHRRCFRSAGRPGDQPIG